MNESQLIDIGIEEQKRDPKASRSMLDKSYLNYSESESEDGDYSDCSSSNQSSHNNGTNQEESSSESDYKCKLSYLFE